MALRIAEQNNFDQILINIFKEKESIIIDY